MEEHQLSGPEHKLERLIFFSDAVFAIAITLLVIDLRAPHLPGGATGRDYAIALLNETPRFGGFMISFFVIGAFWAGHHRAFALARTWSDRLIGPNLMLLCAIAALPFFTAFLSANAGGRLPALLYCLWLMIAGLLNMRLQRLVVAPPVVDPNAPTEQAAVIRRRGGAVVLGAALAFGLALIAPIPALGLLALMTIGLWRRLLTRVSA